MAISTSLSISALLVGTAILLLGNGLQLLLVPVRANLEGFTTGAIGLITSGYALGFVISCFVTPGIVKRVGHIRAFAVLAAITAASVLALTLLIHPLGWLPLRTITGFCMAGLFMVIESWLNERASNENRGQVFASYMAISFGAMTGGQLLLPTADPAQTTLFVVVGIAVTLALVPVGLTTASAPRPITQAKLRLGYLYRVSPVGLVGCLFVGLANGAFVGLAPLYTQNLGLSVTQIALFASAAAVGGALAQQPLGGLSDRIDRRWVMIIACAGAGVAELFLLIYGGLGHTFALTAAAPWIVIGAAFVNGCFLFSMYGLCVAHANDFVDPDHFVETSSGLLLTFGVGATAGPLVAATLMQQLGNGALFAYLTAIHSLFALFTLYRITRRAAPTERTAYVGLGTGLARTTPTAIELDPRAPDEEALGGSPNTAGESEVEGGKAS